MARINYAKLYTLRKDGRYQGYWHDTAGVRHAIYDRNPEKLYKKIQAKESPDYVTFATVADEWETLHRQEIGDKTWSNYKPHIKDIIAIHGSRPVKDISALDVMNDLKIAQARGYSATVISTRRSLYRMILDHALVCGHINYNPAIGVKMPKGIERKRREAPDEAVVKKILASADVPFALFPILLICSGLRKAEALALTWGDIGKDNITVNKALDYAVHTHPVVKPPKTQAGNRSIPIIAALRPHLIKPKGAKETDLIFPAPNSNRSGSGGGYMTERQYEGAWTRYCSAMGFVDENGKPTLTAHQLRHGTATLLFESGVDMLTAQTILGHASPTTTREIYTHLREKHQTKMVQKFDDMMSKMLSETAKDA